MTEVEVNGVSEGELDFTETKASLSSSSTYLRIGTLHTLAERLSNNGKTLYICHDYVVWMHAKLLL